MSILVSNNDQPIVSAHQIDLLPKKRLVSLTELDQTVDGLSHPLKIQKTEDEEEPESLESKSFTKNPLNSVNDIAISTLSGEDAAVEADDLLDFSDTALESTDALLEKLIAENPDLPVIDARTDSTKFKPLTKEQVDKMNIQQLLQVLLQACYLIQHDHKRTNSEFLHTLQTTLDLVVKRLSEMQGTTNWAIPAFIGIGLSGIAPVLGNYKTVLEATGGALSGLKDVMQQVDRSTETPVNAEQTQLQGTIQSRREQNLSNEVNKALDEFLDAFKRFHDTLIRMFGG